ncbi:MAG TPA: hypothetical protein VFE71_06360 [Bacteroidales bacterium]|nr:hypothetical protein [Bacteroidales bacterium]
MIDLNMSYGEWGEKRLIENINEKEEALGRRLDRDEILREYRALDEELFPMLMSRRGK